jgi:hypothetical protein
MATEINVPASYSLSHVKMGFLKGAAAMSSKMVAAHFFFFTCIV